MKSYTIKEINEVVKGELVGNTDHQITGPEQLDKATENHIIKPDLNDLQYNSMLINIFRLPE